MRVEHVGPEIALWEGFKRAVVVAAIFFLIVGATWWLFVKPQKVSPPTPVIVEATNTPSRFEAHQVFGSWKDGICGWIITDHETKREYMYVAGNVGGSLIETK